MIDLQPVVGADLVGERGREVLVEAQVVAELLAGPRGDLEAQPELVGVGLVVAQLDAAWPARGRDLDDRLAAAAVPSGLGARPSRGLMPSGYRRRKPVLP